ncbi:Uma2 family endonuclease [Lachnospiraceae bacterium KK002]
MALPAEKNCCTLADYLAWPGTERVELLEGEAVLMAPPARVHQEISGELFRQLANFLEGKKCRVYTAPFAVRLFEGKDDRPEDVKTVVEPDITVVCDGNRLDKYGCKGAPDLVMEILSPSTRRQDRLVKLNLYQQAGVPEYWIVNPEDKTVQVMLSDNGILRLHEDYGQNDVAKVNVLDGCFIELHKVFAE